MSEDIKDRIRAVLDAKITDMKSLSLAADLKPTYISEFMRGRFENPAGDKERRLITVLTKLEQSMAPTGIKPAEAPLPLATTLPKDVPVFGTAAGSALDKGAFQITPGHVDFVRRPPGISTARDVYALYVEGESMSPKFDHGDLIYVNPNRPVRSGDYVVIQEPDGDEYEIRGWVKRFVRKTATAVIVEQLNPPMQMEFANSPALKVHLVLTLSDLLGM